MQETRSVAANGKSSEVGDRKSTRLNSSHLVISYAVFCLKKKKNYKNISSCSSATISSVNRYLKYPSYSRPHPVSITIFPHLFTQYYIHSSHHESTHQCK